MIGPHETERFSVDSLSPGVEGAPVISERTMRVILAVIAAYHAATGVLALVDAHTFFEQIGRYGVENDHYIGDVGAFYLGFGIALLVAVQRPGWRVPLLALGALWYGFHALNHAFDVGEARSDARGVFDTVALAIGALVSAYLAWSASRLGRAREAAVSRERETVP
jgi:hypothetical protein